MTFEDRVKKMTVEELRAALMKVREKKKDGLREAPPPNLPPNALVRAKIHSAPVGELSKEKKWEREHLLEVKGRCKHLEMRRTASKVEWQRVRFALVEFECLGCGEKVKRVVEVKSK